MNLRISLIVMFTRAITFHSHADELIRAEEPVPNEYIVVLSDDDVPGSTVAAAKLTELFGGEARAKFQRIFKGFHVVNLPEPAAIALSHHPWVETVEEVAIGYTASGSKNTDSFPTSPVIPEADLWGLDRTDQPSTSSPKRDGWFNYCTDGQGVRVYVVDTGVWDDTTVDLNGTWYPEFINSVGALRVEHPASLPDVIGTDPCRASDAWLDSPNAAHGTAVASLAGGNTFGVAPRITIVDARALDCQGQGTSSDIYEVLEWIPTDLPGTSKVVNLSFSFNYKCSRPICHFPSWSSSINRLVTDYGIMVVAAAGNDGLDAYKIYPASTAQAITAGGLNKVARYGGVDSRWPQSNYGYGVDIYAPAQFVESAHWWPNNGKDRRSESGDCNHPAVPDTCTSGTSFAAPHVTGAVARYLSQNPGATRSAVLSWLYAEAASGNGSTIDNGDGTTKPVLNISDCQ